MTITKDGMETNPPGLEEQVQGVIRARVGAVAEKQIRELFANVFPIVDLDEWKAAIWPPGRRPEGNPHRGMTDAT